MADNVDTPYGKIATDEVGTAQIQLVKIGFGPDGVFNNLPGSILNGILVDVSRIIAPISIAGVVGVTGPLTDVQLRAAAIPVTKSRVPLTGSAPSSVAVGVASALAVAANAARKGLILVNTSANWIFLAFGVPAVLNSGIALAPNGSYEMGEFDFSVQEIRAIASGAASNLAIQEFV